MKKPVIISLIVAGSLVLVGLILSVVGLVVSNFAPERLRTERFEEKFYTTEVSGLSQISVESSNRGIKVIPAFGEEVRITYYESAIEQYSFSKEGGRLVMDYVENRRIFPLRLFSFRSRTEAIVIEIPTSYAGSLKVKTSNASLNVNDLGQLEAFEAITSNAAVKIQNLQFAGESLVKTSNGSLLLEKVAAGKLIAQTSNGQIEANSVTAGLVEFKTSNSRIEFKDLTADQIDLVTSNARVTGSIVGNSNDYQIESDTSNADNSLINLGGSGPKRLAVKTSNGDIEVLFTQ